MDKIIMGNTKRRETYIYHHKYKIYYEANTIKEIEDYILSNCYVTYTSIKDNTTIYFCNMLCILARYTEGLEGTNEKIENHNDYTFIRGRDKIKHKSFYKIKEDFNKWLKMGL